MNADGPGLLRGDGEGGEEQIPEERPQDTRPGDTDSPESPSTSTLTLSRAAIFTLPSNNAGPPGRPPIAARVLAASPSLLAACSSSQRGSHF